MRAPFQVLVIPFRRTTAGLRIAVLKRSDANYWQFVAGGGEDDETPIQAAQRETQEEVGIAGEFIRLDSLSTVPKDCFAAADSWDDDVYVIPEHCFAVDAGSSAVSLSQEHIEFQWVTYEQACNLLKWDSNRTALWELNERLKATDHAASSMKDCFGNEEGLPDERYAGSNSSLPANSNAVFSQDRRMDIRIRQGTHIDEQSLIDLDTVVPIEPARAEFITRWLREDTVLVAEANGQIIGYGVFNHAFFHQGQVEMLMIHQAYRGKRVGEHLLNALEKLCDTPRFYVTTNLSNHRMQKLLSRMGFSPGGYIHELDPGGPELIYVKDVDNPAQRTGL